MLSIIRFYIEKRRKKRLTIDNFSGELVEEKDRKCFSTYYLVIAVAIIIVILNSFEGLGSAYQSILVVINGVEMKK